MQRAREWLKEASSIAVLTGAGISAESGIPTFRGDGGLWRNYRAENLATPEAFERDPKLVWEWYEWRRSLIAKSAPNAAHLALATLENQKPDFTLVTQNVDDLHHRAGSRRVLRLHGDIWMVRCTRCGLERIDPRAALEHLPPHCACGGMERPGVVWFGEALPETAWREACQAASHAGVLLIVGTSAVVQPAGGLASVAKASGAKIVEINIAETPLSGVADVCLRGPAAEILPQLVS